MGANFAHDLANEDFGLSLEQAVSIHLTANHYPPVPSFMVPVAVKAIEHANGGEWDGVLDLPEGVSWRGETSAPVDAIIEAFHLDAFVLDDDEA